MTSAYEKFEQLLRAEMRKIYSETTIDHIMNPRNIGRLDDANGYAKITGPCGDTMQIFLKIEGNRIVDAKFLTNGCGATIACGSMVTELVKGRTVAEAQKINHEVILKALGGLPEQFVHYSILASNTLKAALESYLNPEEET